MMFEAKLAWRYFRSGRRKLVGFTSLAAIVGIAVGLASYIAAQALAAGFAEEIRVKILSSTSHITVTDVGAAASDWRIVKRAIERNLNVIKVEPTTYESAVVVGKTASGYAVIRVVPDDRFPASVNPGSREEVSPPVTVAVGKELANRIGLLKGERADVVTVGQEGKAEGATVLIGGYFETGLYDYDSSWIYVRKSDYLRLKGIARFRPSTYGVFVKDVFGSDITAESLRKTLGSDFKVLDWQEANKPLFSALSLERLLSLSVIALIILVASLNITTTLALLVKERAPDIAILRTCGASRRKLAAVFLFEGWIISMLGILIGVSSGLGICFLGNHYHLLRLSKEVYLLSYIPFRIEPVQILFASAVAFLLCTFSMVVPVRRAGNMKPLENLRMK